MSYRGLLVLLVALWCIAQPFQICAARVPGITETFTIRAEMSVNLMRPPIAASDRAFFTCWTSTTSNDTRILGMRLDRYGTPLDHAPLKIADGALHPRVSSDGKGFLVLWRTGDTVWTRLVHADGTLGEAVPSVSTNSQYPYAAGEIAWGDGAYIIASFAARDVSHPRRPATAYEVVFWRVGADGRFLDGAPLITGAGTVVAGQGGPPYNLRLAGSRRGVLAVWQETYGLKGALVRRSELVPMTISPNVWSDATPAVAANNREFFVLWRTFNPGREGISGVRLGLNGKPISEERLIVPRETDWPDWPAICPTRRGWLLAWMTKPFFTNAPNPFGTNATIHGIELRRDGRQQTRPFVIEEVARPFVLSAASTGTRRNLVITGRRADSEQIDLVGHRVE